MITLGIISDSHQRVDIAKSAINYLKDKKIDLLLHAGDIVKFQTLELMKKSGIKYRAVLGNNDTNLKKHMKKFELFEEPYNFKFEGLKIRMMHYPFYFSNDADINIYGHTHYFVAVLNKNHLYINSGEICGRKKPLFEFAYLTYEDKKFRVFKVWSEASEKPVWSEREILLDGNNDG
ncbi:YfcE family phosphodiesterase [Campylobacter geochelonis]|uniref:Phosphoesterase n=1 Tax=Campylobacter geochelonis TaxID=1780362 RepID=A0A128ECF1_9BACT|nr:YfcE family phosphodiesterase [Campylobacter geochelonis]QKF72100.1 metallophosphoesterase [Campylobacter geochelonis]CZE45898.1 phosphodiesterase [Campylobacter geochelonis]CZE46730.1 phosphodiesterase [Campylobacter geochelonis]CZE49813.1 phosphodiesterase [Campylobacter geochelonis]